MKRSPLRLAGFLVLVSCVQQLCGAQLLLDADTPGTGSLLNSTPLVTPYGTITFTGEIRGVSDPEFIAAGAVGNVFDIFFSSPATLTFGFEVTALTFIYGGNVGVFDARARDINGATVASFYQASTDAGQPAGPVTLSGAGIRSLYWQDPGNSFAAIDNLMITVVPEPSFLSVLGLGIALLSGRYCRNKG